MNTYIPFFLEKNVQLLYKQDPNFLISKLMKIYLRSSMSETRLTDLATISKDYRLCYLYDYKAIVRKLVT